MMQANATADYEDGFVAQGALPLLRGGSGPGRPASSAPATPQGAGVGLGGDCAEAGACTRSPTGGATENSARAPFPREA